ncbi:MAG: hypothetical protein AAB377_01650 [Patescibacteria group bacterium]
MKTKYFLSIGVLSFGLIVSAFFAINGASAQTPIAPAVNPAANIQYPIAELGNCASESSCRTYCDDVANSAACISFAEKNNLMSKDEVRLAKNFEKSGKKGPGGCTSKDGCETYCNDSANINECVAFAEQNNLMSKDQLAEAKKVQAAIASGVKPPACGGKQACDKYCSDSTHVEECMAFAKAAGFMTPEEAQNSDKVIAAIKKGVKPPACRGKECDKYCSDSAHTEECIAFSEAAGMMTSEQATVARKTGGKGPGGCVGKEQCDAFCNDSANQETCFSFGRDNGLIPPEQLQKMEEGKKQFTGSLNQAPAQVLTCISGVVGADSLEKFKTGTLMPPRDIGDKIGECFRQGMPPGGPGEGGNIPPAGQGPGDAKSFQPGPGNMNPGGKIMPQQSGPGGCKTPEECQSFCTSNPDVCKNFQPSGGPQQGEGDQNQDNRREMMPGTQSGQGQSNQQNQPRQQPNQPVQSGQGGSVGPCGTGPGTCSGIGPDDIKSGQPGQNMMQPGNYIQGGQGQNQNQSGSFMPNSEQMQQFQNQMQSGTQQGGTPPSGNQQFQQPQQQFQSPPPGGGGTPPPPSGGTPPSPGGGSLIQSVQSFFGF